MGLGNTLIIVPLTLISHWVNEAHKFIPSMRIIVLHKSLSTSHEDNLDKIRTNNKQFIYHNI